VDILLRKLAKAAREQGIPRIALAGGVSANSALRKGTMELGQRERWEVFIPPFVYCTDNAAMIAMAGHFLHAEGHHVDLDAVPFPRA
jgi:N6-L-threonylcarbamoyladenine synthase